MKKLLMICSTLNTGGAPKIISNLTMHFPKEWKVDILLNSDDDIEFPYKGNIISLNIKEPKSRTSFKYQGEVFIKRIRALRKLKSTNSYDACISFMDSANIVNILTGNKYCKTIINIVNNMSAQGIYEPLYKYLINPLGKFLYNRSDRIVALSQEVKDDMINNFKIEPDKIVSIYCSIDLDDINMKASKEILEEDRGWFDKEKTIVTAGRMERQKGQWHLIRAFSEVVKEIPDAKLVIFGEGSLKKYLEKLVKSYHIEDNTLFAGFTNQLNTYIAHSAIFVFPSIYEGFGTALQEALACNIPCVSSDYMSGGREQLAPNFDGKIEGYIRGEYGIVVEKLSKEMKDASVPLDNSEQAMADAIIELLRSKKTRESYAQKAKERSKDYDIHCICNQWIKLLQ